MSGYVTDLPTKRYLVTCTETVQVEARTEEQAELFAKDKLSFSGSDTTDYQVEEIEE